MIETAIELTDGRVESGDVRAIIGFGHEMLAIPCGKNSCRRNVEPLLRGDPERPS